MFNSIASRSQNLVPELNLRESATRLLPTALLIATVAWLFVAAGWETDYWLTAEARLINNITTGETLGHCALPPPATLSDFAVLSFAGTLAEQPEG